MALRDLIPWGRGAGPAAKRAYSLDFPTPMLWGLFGGGGSNAGVPVTPLSAMQSATVYACVLCLSEDIGKLPVQIQKRVDRGGFEVDEDHPLNELFRAPNSWQTAIEFWAYMVTALKLRGNGIAAIRRGWDGRPEALIPLNWDRVSVMLSPNGTLFYNVSHPMLGAGVTFHQDDMLHIRNIMVDGGYLGMSPIAVAQDVVGLALAAQTHGAVMFRQGTQVAGFLKTASSLTEPAARRIAEDWKNTYSGVQNSSKVAVLEQGLDFQKIQMTAEEAQFLESRRFSTEEICRLFRVPPHKVQNLSNAHFSNLEQSEQSYVNDALQPTAVRAEQSMERVLLFGFERARYRIMFDFSALLRGDFKTRMEGYAIALTQGVYSVNDIRAMEGEKPVENGDQYRVPLNTGALGAPGGPGGPQGTAAGAIGTPGNQAPSAPSAPPGGTAPIETETAGQAVV